MVQHEKLPLYIIDTNLHLLKKKGFFKGETPSVAPFFERKGCRKMPKGTFCGFLKLLSLFFCDALPSMNPSIVGHLMAQQKFSMFCGHFFPSIIINEKYKVVKIPTSEFFCLSLTIIGVV